MTLASEIGFHLTLILTLALTLHVIVRRGADGRMSRTGWAGIWSPTTLQSEAQWRLAHRVALPAVGHAAAGTAISGLACMVLAWDGLLHTTRWVLPSLYAIFTLWVNIGAMRGIRAARVQHPAP